MKKFTKFTKDQIMKSLNEWEYGTDPMMSESSELFTIKAQKGTDIHDVDSALSKKAADEMVKDYQNEFGSDWKIFAVPTKSDVSENSTENQTSEIAVEDVIYEILKNQSHRDEKKQYTLKQLEQLSKEDVEKIYNNIKKESNMNEAEQTSRDESSLLQRAINKAKAENNEWMSQQFSYVNPKRMSQADIEMAQDFLGELDEQLDNPIQDKGKFGDGEFEATPNSEPTSDCGCKVIDENLNESVWGEIRSDFTDEDGTTMIDAWRTDDDNEEGAIIAKVSPDGFVEYLDDNAKSDAYAQEVIRDVVKEKTGQVSEAKKVNPWAVCTSSVGREDKAKYEKCVMAVKEKQGMHENLTENKETEKSVVNEADIQTRNKMANETSKVKSLNLIKKVQGETAKLTKADLKNMISNELKSEKEAFQDRAATGNVGDKKDTPKNQSFNETSAKLKTGEKVDDAIAMMRGDGMQDFLDSTTIEPSDKYKEQNIKDNITPDLSEKKFDTQYGKVNGNGYANVDTEMKVNHQVLKNMEKKSELKKNEPKEFNRYTTKQLKENFDRQSLIDYITKKSEAYGDKGLSHMSDEDLKLIAKDIDETTIKETNSLVSEDIRKSYSVDKVVLNEETQKEIDNIKKLFGYNPTTYVKTKGNTPNVDLSKFKNL